MDNKLCILESSVRQTFASSVWTHKIHEKQCEIYNNCFSALETIKLICTTLTSAGIIATAITNEKTLAFISAIVFL